MIASSSAAVAVLILIWPEAQEVEAFELFEVVEVFDSFEPLEGLEPVLAGAGAGAGAAGATEFSRPGVPPTGPVCQL